MATVVYHNLGQCVGDRVVYLRSTDIEQMNWHRLLWSVPDEWMYRWSIGDDIEVYDITSNRRGGKIKRIFAPVFVGVAAAVICRQPVRTPENFTAHIAAASDALDGDVCLSKKYKLWRGKIKPENIRIKFFDDIVDKEPNTIHKP